MLLTKPQKSRKIPPGKREQIDRHERLTWGAVGSVSLKVANALLALVATIVLARGLGVEDYGRYSHVLSIITLFAVPVQLGFPTLLVREVARYEVSLNWGLLRGLLHRSNQAVLAASAITFVAVVGTVYLVIANSDDSTSPIYFWGLVLLPFIALGNLRGAALRGMRRVVQGQLPELLIRPGVMLVLVLLALLLGRLTASAAMALHALAAAVALLIGVFLLRRALPHEFWRSRPQFDTKRWFGSVLPLSFVAGTQIIISQADLVMLGLFRSDAEVGFYRVAMQCAALVLFARVAIGMVLQPHIARLYAKNDRESLQRIATRGTRVIFAGALPVAAGFIFFGKTFLDTAFGAEFEGAYPALVVLCTAEIVRAAFGVVGLMLDMTGHERTTAKCFLLSALVNVGGNLLLIPHMGVLGAAIASGFSYVLLIFLVYHQTWRLIRVDGAIVRLRKNSSSR